MITPLQVRNLLAADLTYASRIRVVSPPPSPQPVTVSNPPFSRTGTMICYTGKAIKFLAPTIPWVKKVVDHVEAQMVGTALVEENQRLRNQVWQVEQDGKVKAAKLEACLEDAWGNEQELKEEVQRLAETNARLEEEKRGLKEENDELHENLTKAEQEVVHVNAQLIDKRIAHENAMEAKAQAEQKVVVLTKERDDLVEKLDEEKKAREAEQLAAKEEIQAIKDAHQQEMSVALGQLQAAAKEEIQTIKDGHYQEMDEVMELKVEAEKKVVALSLENHDLTVQLDEEKKAREDEKLAAKEANQELQENLIKTEHQVAHVGAQLAKMEVAHDGAVELKVEAELKVVVLTQERDNLKAQLDEEGKGREAEKLAAKEANQELHDNLFRAEQQVAHLGSQLAKMEAAHDGAVESKVEAELKVVALTQEKDDLKAQLDDERKGREAEKLAAKEANHELIIAHKEEIQVLKVGHRQEVDEVMELNTEAEQKVVALTQEKDDLMVQLDAEKKGRQAEKLAAKEANQELHKNLFMAEQKIANVGAQLIEMQIVHKEDVELKVEAQQKVVALTQEKDGLVEKLDEERKGREAEKLAAKDELQTIKDNHRQEMDVTLGQLHAAWDKATNLEGQLENTQGSLAASEDQNGFLIAENRKLQKRTYALQEKVDAVVEKAIVKATAGTEEVKVVEKEQVDDPVEQVILRATGGVKTPEQEHVDAMIEKKILQATTREAKSEEQAKIDAMVEKAILQATMKEVKAEKQEPMDFKAMLATLQGNFEARDRQVKARAVSPLTPPLTPAPHLQSRDQVVFPPTPQSPFVGRFYCNDVPQKRVDRMDGERKSRETRDFVADVPWS